MAPTIPSFQDADPDDLGRREFSKHRKGWDPVEVRAHLLAMAAEIKRLRTLTAEQERAVARLEDELARQREFDESRLTQMLGEETARVLEAARTAATEIRDKAEDNAARLVSEAQERADALLSDATTIKDAAQQEADELTASARATAEELVATATAKAEELVAEAERTSEELRASAESVLAERTAEAEEAAERIRAEAAELLREATESAEATRSEADEYAASTRLAADEYAEAARRTADEAVAEQRRAVEEEVAAKRAAAEEEAAGIVDAAMERGRGIVAEARDARERMLRDLAEKRAASKRQLEALRAGRERLLEAFATARSSFDEITEDLTLSLPAARDAAEAAARTVDTSAEQDLDALAAELGLEDLADAEPPSVVEEPAAQADEPAEVAATEAEAPDEGGEAEAGDEVEGEAAAAVVAPIELARSEEAEGETSDEPVTDPADGGGATTAASHLRLVAAGGPEDHLDDEDEDDGEVEPASADVDPTSGAAEAIFARLRADGVGDTAAEAEPESSGAVLLSITGEVPVTSVDDAGASTAPADDEAEEPAARDDAAWLDARDGVLAPLERGVVRRIKRTLTDHENTVRDAVRRHRKGAVPVELVGELEELRDAVAAAVRSDVGDVVTAGATFHRDDDHGVFVDAAPVADQVLAEMCPPIVEPLRARLVAAVEQHASDGVDELDVALRSIFREWRNDHVPELAGDLVTAAFNEGILRSAQEGAAHVWVVDDGGLPNPDAEDNRLAGPVSAGDEFPTGHHRPPAHPGCRCLLVPAPR